MRFYKMKVKLNMLKIAQMKLMLKFKKDHSKSTQSLGYHYAIMTNDELELKEFEKN